MCASARKEGSEAAMNETTLKLQGDREIVITRAFNGPARIVFDAWTRPELVRRWWAPKSRGVSIVSCDASVRAGGFYRYVMDVRGRQMAFSGTYHEVAPPSRLVYTQIFEPSAAGPTPDDVPVTVTVTFEEHDGRTHVVSHTLCPTAELRDAIIATGMESGMRETMDLLDELVAAIHGGSL
jgi:uncharacterized protein YndB with AHSA1/START domain